MGSTYPSPAPLGDYKALRGREALLALAPEIKVIVSPLLFFFFVTLALWLRQRMTYGR